MRENSLLIPSDSTTRRHLLPVEKAVAGHGLASGASIASGGLESFFWRMSTGVKVRKHNSEPTPGNPTNIDCLLL
jgi:hypothetical protein